ncbi:MAG: hypothetical protein GX077_08940 [Tissierellia bacterium]|nr:hypothetical protein [Tissierellia bacterium]
MKKVLNYLKLRSKEKERQRVLDNFYTKQMKNGKTTRADILDKIALSLAALLFLVIFLNRFLENFILSLFLSVTIGIVSIIYLNKYRMKLREKKIEEIKREYKKKLEEEKVLLPDEDIEDYIISRYYEKKSELRKSINFLNKDKIYKLYLLFIVFFIMSYFSPYPTYYKIMAIVSFLLATIIGSYNITEYIRKKYNNDLHKRDIDI